jgi:hypothetical protein
LPESSISHIFEKNPMKKLLLAFSLILCALTQSHAQYGTAIGLKGGYLYGPFSYGAVSVKHNLGGSSYIEGNLGGGYRHLWFQALYEKNFNIEGGLDWYLGGGGDLGVWTNGYHYYYNGHHYSSAFGGLDGVIGLEYAFDEVPIDLAIDATPTIRLFPYVGFHIYGSFAVRFIIQ